MTEPQGFNPQYGRLPEPPRLRPTAMALRLALMALAAATVALEHGFYEPRFAELLLRGAQVVLLAIYAADVIARKRTRTEPLPGAGAGVFEWGLFALAAAGMVAFVAGAAAAWRLVEFVAVVLFCAELWRVNMALSRALARPGVLLPISFLLLIGIGTLLLMMPVATPAGQPIGFVDALFTATSAVCVTGLIVRDTATGFAPFGHLVIAVLIQLVALGIIIFGSVLALLFGRGLSLRENVSLGEMLHDQPVTQITRFVRFIVLVTIGLELLTAAMAYPLWQGDLTVAQRTAMSLFHAVSAFCNAGFDLTGQSLIAYRNAPLAHAVILPAIVVGAIGFPVIENLWRTWRDRVRGWMRGPLARPTRLSVHTKVVLATSVIVPIVGMLAIALGQLTLATTTNPGQAMLDGAFLAWAARTAGFTTIDMAEVSDTGVFSLMVLMLIGGSPGSPAGGMKTTVLALLFLSVVATLRNRPETEAFRRTLSDALVRRAATIAICYLGLAVVAVLVLSVTEAGRFDLKELVFDTVSAAGTVGLAFGVPAEASDPGRIVLAITMFLGRVGPLTLLGALMLAGRRRQGYRYAHEDVVLG